MGLAILNLEFEGKPPGFEEVVTLIENVTELEFVFDKHREIAFKQYPNEKVRVRYNGSVVSITYVMGQLPVLGYIIARAFEQFGGKCTYESSELTDEYWRAITERKLRILHRKNTIELNKLMVPIYLVVLGVIFSIGFVFYKLMAYVF